EHDGDFALEHFSIERDHAWLLPYVQKALALRPDMTLFASPWSPPVWMKEPRRYNGGSLRDDPEVHRAYAEYLLRFVRAYRELSVEIAQVHVQNEPNSDQKFPSCLWTGAGMRDFIRDYLGPRFAEADEACEIWAGTIERGVRLGWEEDSWKNHTYKDWAHTILADAEARRYVAGVGYQWNGKGALAETHASWPDLPIIQTENECGDGNNCWDYAFYVFQLMWDYFNHGTVAYVYWNMILPPGGDSTWGWKQNTMITVDADAQAVVYNPEYFVMKHFAHAVQPGAKFLPMRGHHGAFSLL
ncbi:MAG: glycosyl hydrolase, partial [Planctomycetota bacterium]